MENESMVLEQVNMDTTRTTLSNKIQAAGRLNEITYKFKVLDTDELRVLTILRIMEMFDTTPQSKSQTKSTQESTDLRNKANRTFVSSKTNVTQLIETWQQYSKSIAFAKTNSPELSLSYANRSAVLLKLRKYDECILDIDRALKLEYPNHLRGKLLCRKIECLKVLSRMDEVNDTLGEARVWMDSVRLDRKERDGFEKKLMGVDRLGGVGMKFVGNERSVPMIVGNKFVPSASEALTVKTNDEFGRHVVTTRDVQPGEILIVEKPYSKILSPDEVYTHCSQCLQSHWAMIPCEFCVYAMYCSEECKDEAWKECHDVECRVNGYLVDLGFRKDGFFSMRLAILAVKGEKEVGKLRERLEGNEGFADDKPYLSDDYVNVYNLVTSAERRSVSDLFERSLNAAFILYYLCTVTNLFGKKFSTDIKEIYMNEDVTFVGGLILRHMQIIPCNIHSYEEERQMDIIDIGALALPFCSLVNHSCDPNVSRCTTKNHMIVFAIVPIEKGSQIYDNYGSHYAVMSRDERRRKLRQYYFECNCEACRDDWPLYTSLPNYTELVKDKSVIKRVEKALEKLDTYVHSATEDQIEDKVSTISELAKMIDTLIRLLPLPCAEVNNAVETLKRVVTLTYGNKFVDPKL